MSRFRKVVAVDFDGVIHRHIAKWTKPHEINDGPVEGAFEFLKDVLREFDIAVFSARAAEPEAREAICRWFVEHWGPVATQKWGKYVEPDSITLASLMRRGDHTRVVGKVTITARKPHAFLYIDDRGWRFDGTTVPTMGELRAFAACDSWTKKATVGS
jgi:hypothetical protein